MPPAGMMMTKMTIVNSDHATKLDTADHAKQNLLQHIHGCHMTAVQAQKCQL